MSLPQRGERPRLRQILRATKCEKLSEQNLRHNPGRGCASWRLRGAGILRHQAEAGREFLGALQRSWALFETGAMMPEVIGKSRIALDRLVTAGTLFPLEKVLQIC